MRNFFISTFDGMCSMDDDVIDSPVSSFQPSPKMTTSFRRKAGMTPQEATWCYIPDGSPLIYEFVSKGLFGLALFGSLDDYVGSRWQELVVVPCVFRDRRCACEGAWNLLDVNSYGKFLNDDGGITKMRVIGIVEKEDRIDYWTWGNEECDSR